LTAFSGGPPARSVSAEDQQRRRSRTPGVERGLTITFAIPSVTDAEANRMAHCLPFNPGSPASSGHRANRRTRMAIRERGTFVAPGDGIDTTGWTRELWIEALGMPAVLPPPEETKEVKTAIGAARAKMARKDML
jgi:hypothetical protein